MNRLIARLGGAGLVMIASGAAALAQQALGTAFTYQGRLDEDDRPVSATADFRFRLFDDESAGNLIAQDVVSDLGVVEGLFTASVDFGATAFNGDARWVEIATRIPAGGGSFTTLTPRQPLTAAPYARFGAAAPWAGLTGVPAGFADGIDNGSGDGHSLDAADGSPTDVVFVDNDGDVGIGTASPLAKLHVNSGDLYMGLPTNGWFFHTRPSFGGDFMHITDTVNGVPQFQRGLALNKAGNVGVGTTGIGNRLHVVAGFVGDGIRVDGTGTNSPGYHLYEGANFQANLALALGNGHWSLDANPGDIVLRTNTGKLLLQNGGQSAALALNGNNVGIGTAFPAAKLDVNGTTRTKVLEITGADLAEKFPISDKVEPGMVVAIDPQNPGKLCTARGAYNRCVAGIVSGAKDFSVGAVLGHLPGHEDAPPVALSGRVYVQCDTSNGAIEPGDLLTTSEKPGHAMKVTDFTRAQGAVLGKAMTALRDGQGHVLVLVSLQ